MWNQLPFWNETNSFVTPKIIHFWRFFVAKIKKVELFLKTSSESYPKSNHSNPGN
ncbi:hypothetical protein FD05_GL000694 [Lentilactobacillus otakiensis DSM 19908 = JCM 15040]|uniref:Uncharacterized protein n=1 Tax=Lentilactobacillus otakiensis DSM 19908 = JCM 15040 TaxID=1423780 RepID=S4NLE3_9LACO|nr:hypothetical protein FD05_GL000694 [Lentilactobacillus otakiensis DSM 19908 = JCM 15040]GAD16701.1 hypothetical protein LOT_1239 [Lentilactobacillus otakiensis DSM 19908 = JCM 15040]